MAKKKKVKPKKKESRSEEAGGMVFVGCLMAGIGLGLWKGRPEVGTLVGLGIGFIIMGIMKAKMKD